MNGFLALPASKANASAIHFASSPRVIKSPPPKVVAVLPLVIPSALRAFTAPTARGFTSVKPAFGAFTVSRFNALATKTAAS